MKPLFSRRALALAAIAFTALVGCATGPSAPPETVTVRANVFRGASNIPLYMAIERGYFAKRGIKPELQFTPNSSEQRAGLAAGKFEIAHAAVDNAVAMVEVAKHDVIIVAGGDAGMNEFLVQRDINHPSEVRGKTYVVDAPNTAYALIGRKILKNAGLADGKDFRLNPLGGSEARAKAFQVPENAATLLNPPWSIIAKEQGAKSLGRTIDLFGPYQAGGAFVMRRWASANGPVLERYIAAYIEGCRATHDPANRAETLAVLQRELKLTPKVAEITYQELNTPRHGLARDCAFDMDGFRNVLALRAEIEGQWGGKAPAPDLYLDLGFFDRALRLAGGR